MIEKDPSNLPVSLTRFVGREREVNEVRALLAEKGVRLVTLTGPGGDGKTRLAIAAGQSITASGDTRLLFVDLAPIADPDLVMLAIAQRLDVRDSGDAPLESRVSAALSEEPTLLILDNFEQIIEAAPLLPRLLASCPSLRILVTSRERLRLSPERDFEVLPLRLPNTLGEQLPAQLMESEAVRLFVERATAVKHDFALTPSNAGSVADICKRLDGLPLAIELSAARVSALPPATLLTHLERSLPLLTGGGRDRPLRQQTMRNAIAWSYDFLTAGEQAVFRQIAVFAGGCTLEAAGYVVNSTSVLETLIALVDRSLLRMEEQPDGQPRFRMLETVRQFGVDLLKQSGETDAVFRGHAHYFLALAEGENPDLPFLCDFAWIDRMTADQENLRLALDTMWRLGDDDEFFRLAASHTDFWRARGTQEEASI